MPLITQLFIDRYTIRAHPERLYVFGDNLQRTGSGGQAAQMRNEANALGLITKRRPTMHETAFLRDTDLKWLLTENRTVLFMLEEHLKLGRTVVWPESGIGTGLADLQTRAPQILQYYENLKRTFELITPGASL
jgi:hypothetical protein